MPPSSRARLQASGFLGPQEAIAASNWRCSAAQKSLGFLPEIVVLGLDLGSQRRDRAISTQGNSKASDKASDQVDACFFLLGRQLFRVLTREPLGTSQLEY